MLDFKEAIEKIYFETLPSTFDQWSLKDNYGITVAHIAAMLNALPADFNQWDMADMTGYSVAHEAAFYGNLPSDFNQWDLKDSNGITIKDSLNAGRYKKTI